MEKKMHTQAGFSLMGPIMSMGILSLMGYIWLHQSASQAITDHNSEVSDYISDIEQGMLATIHNQVMKYTYQFCKKEAFPLVEEIPIGAFARLRATQSIDIHPDSPAEFKLAKTRCENPRTSFTQSNVSRYSFGLCYLLEIDAKKKAKMPKNSFLEGQNIFIEYTMAFRWNTSTHANYKCHEYSGYSRQFNNRTVASAVMNVYWQDNRKVLSNKSSAKSSVSFNHRSFWFKTDKKFGD